MAEEVSPKNKILTVILNGLAFLAVGLSLTGWLNPPAGVVLMAAAVVYWLWEILSLRFAARYIASPFHRGLIGMGIFAIIAAACWSPIIKRLHSQEQPTTIASSGPQESKPAETKPQEKTTKENDEARKKAVKEKPKVEQHSQGENSPNVGTLQQGTCSAAVIGGSNNSATANCVPVSRVMTPEKKEAFRNALRSFPRGMIGTVKAGSSDDIGPLENQILQLAKEAEWGGNRWQGVQIAGAGDPQAEGLECYFAKGWDDPMGKAVKGAMKAANLNCKFLDSAYTFNSVIFMGSYPVIVIGRNVPQ